jgi:small-conductance mechanosensitive channel/predicted  nucleic acid-binding Zn-ribbon protein
MRGLYFSTYLLRFCTALLLALSVITNAPGISLAETAPEQAEEQTQPEFPGLTEVVPKSTAVTAKATEARTIIGHADSLTSTYDQLDTLEEKLKEIEKQFTGWEKSENWPLNRLMNAEARYNEVDQQQRKLLAALSDQLTQLEKLRSQWSAEKEYWQNWQDSLQAQKIDIPQEISKKTIHTIDRVINDISNASSRLVDKQQEYSPTQEILASRLALIDSALVELRKETFRRNSYSLFNNNFYKQLTPDLFSEYRKNILATLELPGGFWQRHGLVASLQLLSVIILAVLLYQRKHRSKPISEDWRFLFKHPFAGSLFITLAMTSGFYENIPPSWAWMMLALATVSGAVLVGSMAENERRKRLVRSIAVVFIVSETLKITGVPSPAYQLYVVILCALAAPVSLMLARYRQKQHPENLGLYSISLYLICFFSLIGLLTALLGFATLSAHLVDAVVGTIVIVFLVRVAIHLADGGITEFLRLNVIRSRQLTLKLGISTRDRLKTLAHIIILVNAGLYLLVKWGVYADVDEALTRILSIEHTIGEFSISVFMVVMVVIILYLTNLLSWFFQGAVDAHYMTPRNMDLGVKMATKKLLQYAIFTIGFFIAVSMAGLDLQKFTIIAGALGVGIGFGLQNIVNNFVSGLILLFERPVKVGDTINIDDQWGTITKIGLRSTVFETLDRAEIIVPNSELISQKVTNWTFTTNVSRVVLTVGVAYGSPLDKVLEILNRVAEEHPDILDEPQSSAIFTGFGDSSIDFELRAWISDISKRLKVKSELGQSVDRYFRDEGITIPFPQRDLHLRSIDDDLKKVMKNSADEEEQTKNDS